MTRREHHEDDALIALTLLGETMAQDATVHDAAINSALWAIKHTSLFNGGEFLHGLHSSESFKYAVTSAVLALKSQPAKAEPAKAALLIEADDKNKKVLKFKKKLYRLIAELINLEELYNGARRQSQLMDTRLEEQLTGTLLEEQLRLEEQRKNVGIKRDDKQDELDQHITRIKAVTAKVSK